MHRAWAIAVIFLSGCGGDDQEHDKAVDLYNLQKDRSTYTRARDYPTRRPSFTAHGRQVEIFVNDKMQGLITGNTKIARWPTESLVVKDGYDDNGKKVLTALMYKTATGWFFAEYDADGNPKYSGLPKTCTDCHDNRRDYSDWLYGVDLPR